MKKIMILLNIFFLSLLFTTPLLSVDRVINVVATIPDLGWAAKQIGGSYVNVKTFLRGTENPHYIDAIPKFSKWASEADMVVFAGLDLEVGWLPKVLEQSANPKIQSGGSGFCEVGRAVDPLQKPSFVVDRSMGDLHPRGNPHFWLSPIRLAQGATLIADTLAAIYPEKAAYFYKNLSTFQREMTAQAEKNKQQLSAYLKLHTGPAFIEYHRDLVYWSTDMGIPSFGSIEEKPGVPPSVGWLAKNALNVKRANVPVALMGSFHPRALGAKFKEFSGIPVVVVPLSMQADAPYNTYEAVQQRLVEAILNAK